MGWFERLQADIFNIPIDHQHIIRNSVPPTEALMWLKLLRHLALEMGNRYGGNGELKYPFLPAIWHPALPGAQTRKIPMDVRTHCELLNELLSSPGTEWVSTCGSALLKRREWFQVAQRDGLGIIEITGSVYHSLGRNDS